MYHEDIENDASVVVACALPFPANRSSLPRAGLLLRGTGIMRGQHLRR